MVMPVFLLSIFLAISVSLSALWNAGMIGVRTGGQRAAHGAIVALVISLLAALGLDAPVMPIRLCAIALMLGVVIMCILEEKRRVGLCLLQFAFGALIASGLPFTVA